MWNCTQAKQSRNAPRGFRSKFSSTTHATFFIVLCLKRLLTPLIALFKYSIHRVYSNEAIKLPRVVVKDSCNNNLLHYHINVSFAAFAVVHCEVNKISKSPADRTSFFINRRSMGKTSCNCTA